MLCLVKDLLEESPLGLRLKKSPSLLKLLQNGLSQEHASKLLTMCNNYHSKNIVTNANEKFKASNFTASFLKIGTWECEARYDGDLVAKCYFASQKLVWEFLDSTLKRKIEIQWSNIIGLKASYPDDGPGTLHIVLKKPPVFFKECDPQPRKYTTWNLTIDFTGGQATDNLQNFLQFKQDILEKHFEKLIQYDSRFNILSQQPDTLVESSYFESEVPIFDDSNDLSCGFDIPRNEGPVVYGSREVRSSSRALSFSSNGEAYDFISITRSQETLSPCSGMDTRAMEGISGSGFEEPNLVNY